MASLKHIRLRIKSIQCTRKITKAMQMVSAAKLRRAKNKLFDAKDYYETIDALIYAAFSYVTTRLSPLANVALGNKAVTSKLIFIITGDRGLCGAFNQNILKGARKKIESYRANNINVKIIAIGKKSVDFAESFYNDLTISSFLHSELSAENMAKIIAIVMDNLKDGMIDSCDLYYNFFQNIVTQVPSFITILPLEQVKISNKNTTSYELEGEQVLDNLLQRYIVASIKYAILQSRASEEAARTTAMDNATRNAGEVIKDLTLVMNRSRQAAITNELIEIISGAEAV